jgi:nucleoside-diphosphate-sugar epimerase
MGKDRRSVNVLVPGGCGYIGAMLVPWLLSDGHKVTVFDIQFFGHGHLPDNANLRVIKGDVRDIRGIRDACVGQDAVIWLASLSNNAMCERFPVLHDRINKDAVAIGAFAARTAGVKRFIYASSVAAYGSSDDDAEETQPLAPSTPYGEGKEFGERWARQYDADDFACTVTRSASVCGYSPHQRFDLTVNKMTHDAIRHGRIRVNGGQQKRSHIHIKDICRAYQEVLTAPADDVAGQAFNFVADNQTVHETAQIVAEETGADIDLFPATDDRSYSVSGAKARDVLGFVPRYTVRQAVRDLRARFDDGDWPDSTTNQAYMNMAEGLR